MPRRTWAPNVTLTDPEVGGPVGRLPLGPIRVSGGSPGGVSSWVWGEPAAGLLLKGSEALAGPAGPLRYSAAEAS